MRSRRADELVKAESRNTGKLVPLTRSEEIPPMLDQIRFFAGAARVLEAGRSASTCRATRPGSVVSRLA